MADTEDKTGNSTMLKWILGLVATGLGSAAVWTGAQMKNNAEFTQQMVKQMSDERVDNAKSDLEQTKAVQMLATNIAANTETMKAVQAQGAETVKYLKSIDSVQKRFPAVREEPEP
jgi:hypothetical protein